MSLILNPTVNSYRRLNANTTDSGATWISSNVSWGGNDRTKLIRIPDKGRFELRQPDGSANPYLLQAVVLAAGYIGLRDQLRIEDLNDSTLLPKNLGEAIDAFENETDLQNLMGIDFSSALLNIKKSEWSEYLNAYSEWEAEFYNDF